MCEAVVANPDTDLVFTWSLENETLNETTYAAVVTQDGLNSKITIPATDDKLFGSWTCSVRNSVGESVPDCSLFVAAPIGIYLLFFHTK